MPGFPAGYTNEKEDGFENPSPKVALCFRTFAGFINEFCKRLSDRVLFECEVFPAVFGEAAHLVNAPVVVERSDRDRLAA